MSREAPRRYHACRCDPDRVHTRTTLPATGVSRTGPLARRRGKSNRGDIHRTYIGGQQWFEEDFDDNAEDEDENEADDEEISDEEEGEAAIAAKPAAAAAAKPEAAKKEPAAVKKHIATGEARMQIAGVVRNFLIKNAGENSAGKPG